MTRMATTVTWISLLAWALGAPAAAAPRDRSVPRLRLEPGQVGIEYIAHSCFRLHAADGTRILIDPFASRVWIGYDFPEDIVADAVLITHPHFDHDAGQFMGRSLPWSADTRVLTEPSRYRVGEFSIVGVAGKHAEPYGKEFGQTNTIWIVEIGGLRLVHIGDNGPLSEANQKALPPVDVLMLPVDDAEHILTHDEVTWYRRILEPRILIPMHYRHHDLEPSKGKPDDLGGIGRWLKGQKGVRRLRRNTLVLDEDSLPQKPRIVVFRRSRLVRAPSR